MIVTLITNKQISVLTLPEKVRGQFWITKNENEIVKRVASVEGIDNKWVLKPNKGVIVDFTQEIVDKVIKETNYEKFGARRVDKVIDDLVTPIIVDAWYNGIKEISI